MNFAKTKETKSKNLQLIYVIFKQITPGDRYQVQIKRMDLIQYAKESSLINERSAQYRKASRTLVDLQTFKPLRP